VAVNVRGLAIYAGAMVAAGLLVAAFGGRFVINETPSEPVGLYYVTDEAPAAGDLVLLAGKDVPVQYPWIPKSLLKQVRAVGPAAVKVDDSGVYLNGQLLGPRPRASMVKPFYFDGTLAADQAWLMAPKDMSFDSRHFGPVQLAKLSHKVVPVWTF